MAMPKPIAKAKESWDKQPKKRKRGIIIAALSVLAIIVIAIIITVSINASKPGYKVLYTGLDAQETTEVHTALQDMGVTTQMNSKGEIMVPTEQYDVLLLRLAAQGYPQSAPVYDIWFDNNSMTSTDQDKQINLKYQLQNRLQTTLVRINGVRSAIVNLNIPEETNYVWQKATQENASTASVNLTLERNVELDREQVTAIKNLVAFAVPNLNAEKVVVVDAGTGRELAGTAEGISYNTSDALKAEQMYQQMLEDQVVRLLSARYGSNNVVAVARVTLDFDSMMEERRQPLGIGQNGETPPIVYQQQYYGVNGLISAAEGLVGEENNTDIPSYPINQGPNEEGGVTQFGSTQKYDWGYILTQIQKGEADVTSASISVMVNDNNLDLTRNELIDLISNSTNIAAENISVASMNLPIIEPEPEPPAEVNWLWNLVQQYWIYLVIAGAVLLLLIAAGIFLLVFMKKRSKKKAAIAQAQMAAQQESMAQELEAYRRKLEETAKAGAESPDTIIIDEVRNFAKENPEITASLIRGWLKEDE